MTDLQREPEQLRAATLDSVNAVAEKYANPSHSAMLLVGDRSKVEAGVHEARAGDLVYLDAEGRPAASQ